MTANSTFRVLFQLASTSELAGDSLVWNGSKIHLEGSYVKLVWDIRDALNLNLELIFESDYAWETPIKRLAKGQADLCAMSISQSLFYKDLGLGNSFLFLHAVVSERVGLFFRQPLNKHYPSMLFRPFQPQLWIAFLFLIVFSSCLVILKFKFISKIPRGKVTSEVFLNLSALILGKGFQDSATSGHTSYSLRILLSLFLSTLLVNIYTAKIISTFSNDDGRLVKFREDLIRLGYTFCFWYDFRIDRMFPESFHSSLEKAPFDEIKEWNGYVEIMQKLANPKEPAKLAVIVNHSSEIFLQKSFSSSDQAECSAISSFPSAIKYPKSMILRKDSPMKEILNLKLLQLSERGLRFRYHLSYLNKLRKSCVGEKTELVRISLRHVSIAYFVLFGGAVAALLLDFWGKLRLAFKWRKSVIVYYENNLINAIPNLS